MQAERAVSPCATRVAMCSRSSALRGRSKKSAVDIGHHEIDAADEGDQVGDEAAAADQRDHLQMRKGRGADARAVRHRVAVADQIISVYPLARLDGDTGFPRRNHRPPADIEEM